MPDRYSVHRKPLLDMSPQTLRRDGYLPVNPADDLDQPFALNASVGYGPRANRREDVFLIESALKRIGHLKSGSGPTGHMSRFLDSAVRTFQNDNDLKEDGLLNPGGPTVKSLAEMFGQSAPKPVRSPPSGQSALPKVSAEAFSNNGRSVEHLMSTLDDGSFPALLSDAFNMNEKGQGEVADFFVQLRERDPERAKVMRDKTVPNLGAEQVDAFDQLIDDLATGRAEEAEKWARKNLGEDDKDDSGEGNVPPSKDPAPEPDEENPAPDDSENDKPEGSESDDGEGEKPEQLDCQNEKHQIYEINQKIFALNRQGTEKLVEINKNKDKIQVLRNGKIKSRMEIPSPLPKRLPKTPKDLGLDYITYLIELGIANQKQSNDFRKEMEEKRAKIAALEEKIQSLESEREEIEKLVEEQEREFEDHVKKLEACEARTR